LGIFIEFGEFLIGTPLGITLIFFFLILILLLAIRDLNFFPLKVRFKLNFLYKLLIYLQEILFMFFIFRWVSTSLFDNFLEYDEKGTLKQFIDFFTVYQIFVFVVLNLYDSLKKEIYLSLLHQMESVQPYLDTNKSIRTIIPEVEGLSSHERFLKYDDISLTDDEDHKNFLSHLHDYEKNRENKPELAESTKFQINLLKASVNGKKERIESLWNLSLFLRFSTIFLLKNKK